MAETPTVSNTPGSNETYNYKMDYPEKGLCVIINMENFQYSKIKLSRRNNTSIDETSVKDTFEKMGFEVQIEKDKTCAEIYDIIEKVANDDHSNRSCFVCVVMSHGEDGGFYGSDDFFKEETLFTFFNGENCRSLAGKPKLFFFQKCNGDKKDKGVTLHAESKANGTTIPTEADFLYHYATPPGHVAYRGNGSWFIQSLCEMLEEHWDKMELLHILTLVNHKVAFEFAAKQGKKYKQIPCIVSKLTKFLYLK